MNTTIPPDHDDQRRLLHRVLPVFVLLAAKSWSWGDDAAAAASGATPSASDGSATSGAHTADKRVIVPLLRKDSLETDDWVFVSREKGTRRTDTWRIVDEGDEAVLICSGQPYGYLRTREEYDEFEMELEWRFPSDENGNSGILLHTSDEDKVWPNAVQVQLHQPVAGSIFPSGDAKTDNELRDIRDVARPINQWNTCHISSAGGTISVEMNGKKIGEVTGCRPNKGWIALQSEGSEIHFRRIYIRAVPAVAAPAPRVDNSTSWLVRPVSNRRVVTTLRACKGGVIVVAERHRGRRKGRQKVSHVVYRDALASDGPVCDSRDCLCLDVAGQTAFVVAGRGDRLRRADCCCLGY